MQGSFGYRQAFTLSCSFIWHLFYWSLAILGLPSLIVPRLAGVRDHEIHIAVLILIFAVLPVSFYSLVHDDGSDSGLSVMRPTRDAGGLSYLELLQVSLMASAIYASFITAFRGLQLENRFGLAVANLICLALFVFAVSPAIAFSAVHFPFRGFRLVAAARQGKPIATC